MSDVKILDNKSLNESICVVMGTRPGIIKMSPLVRVMQSRGQECFILHTGQHYSYEMDRKFFEDLGLPEAKHHIQPSRPGSLHGEQTANMLAGIEKALLEEKPRCVLVCGDANTNLAGALAARKLQIEVGHVESGLRSFDWRMPEEHNRVMIDHISEYLFAPTERNKKHLIEDNVRGKIYITGNTVVDALVDHKEIAAEKSEIMKTQGLQKDGYILVTSHREENVDHRDIFAGILEGLRKVGGEYDMPIIFPVHPRTANRIDSFGFQEKIDSIPNMRTIEPVGYLDFLTLMMNARLVMSDSGGIQEETCILKVPCVTLRDNTERQETVEVGSNIVAGSDPEKILTAARDSMKKERDWANPFGDGKASRRVIDAVTGKEVEEWKSL